MSVSHTLALYAHPFSSYSWKAQIALGEKGLGHEYRMVEQPDHGSRLAELSPTGLFHIFMSPLRRQGSR